MDAVYVVGLPQVGGAWVWRDKFYATYEDALKTRNHVDEKVFALYLDRTPREGKLAKEAGDVG